MEDGDVVSYHGSLAHHQSGGVIDEDASADLGSWVDVDCEDVRDAGLEC